MLFYLSWRMKLSQNIIILEKRTILNKTKVKDKIELIKGKIIHFKYNGFRNQIEEFDGIIENTYNSIFTIKINESNCIKSFSYNDIINESLQFFI